MNNHKNYITSELKKRVPMIIALLILAGMIAMNVAVPEPVTEPDAEYPIANACVTWEQTFHSGAWSDGQRSANALKMLEKRLLDGTHECYKMEEL